MVDVMGAGIEVLFEGSWDNQGFLKPIAWEPRAAHVREREPPKVGAARAPPSRGPQRDSV